MIEDLKKEYPIKIICEALKIARSTYYDNHPDKSGYQVLLASIETIIMKRPYYGYRRISHQLPREKVFVSEKPVSEGFHSS